MLWCCTHCCNVSWPHIQSIVNISVGHLVHPICCVLQVGHGHLLQSVGVAHQDIFSGRFSCGCFLLWFLLLIALQVKRIVIGNGMGVGGLMQVLFDVCVAGFLGGRFHQRW